MVRYALIKRYERQQEAKHDQLEEALADRGIDPSKPDIDSTVTTITKWGPPFVKKAALFLLILGSILVGSFLLEGYGLLMVAYAAGFVLVGLALYWKHKQALALEDDLLNTTHEHPEKTESPQHT